MAETTNDQGPDYYRRGSINVWDFNRDQELGFHLGNVVKYVCRAGYKNDDIEDLTKAIHYLSNEIESRTSNRVQGSIRCPERTEFSFENITEEFNS